MLAGCFGEPRRGRRARAQALVELALVMPVLVGMILVLFQFGIIFISYLSLIHETRDIGRYVAVHPDTEDGTATSCTSNDGSLWSIVCNDAPTVVNPVKITPSFSPACAALNGSNACASRTAGQPITITLTYDATSSVFLPTNFRLGPWFQVKIPSPLLSYDYTVMIEPH